MDYGTRGLRAPWLLHSVPGPGLALVLFCALSTACASGGAGTSPTGSRRTDDVSVARGPLGSFEITTEASVQDRVISAARITVWAVLPSVFETLGIEATVDPRTFVIGNSGYRARRIEGKRLSTYLECGRGLARNADRYQVTLQLMVQLDDAPDGGTLVRTLLDAYARSTDVSGRTAIHCTSRGTLERRIIELIAEELADDVTR